MNNQDCVVLVPVASTIEPETQDCLSRLMDRGYRVETLRGCSQVDLARSALASMWLARGFKETMWIDSDVVFHPDHVETLRKHNLPMCAGLYVKKGAAQFACKFKEIAPLTFGVGGGLLEVEYVGFGFTHVRAEVYEAVKKVAELPDCLGNYDPTIPITPYFIPMYCQENPDSPDFTYLSEDYAFSMRAKWAGIKRMADTTIKLGHKYGAVKTWDDLIPREKYDALKVGVERN